MDDLLCCYCAGGRLTPAERSSLIVFLDEMIRNRTHQRIIALPTLSGEIWTELKFGSFADFEGMEFYGHLQNGTGRFTIVMLFDRDRYLEGSDMDDRNFELERIFLEGQLVLQ